MLRFTQKKKTDGPVLISQPDSPKSDNAELNRNKCHLIIAIPPLFQLWVTPTQTTSKIVPSRSHIIKNQTRAGTQN